jgi:hypothetical protein
MERRRWSVQNRTLYMTAHEMMAWVVVLALAIPIGVWIFVFASALLCGRACWCPKCGSSRIRRARKRLSDFIFPEFVSPFRCENCKKRYRSLVSFNYRRRGAPAQRFVPPAPIRPGIMYPLHTDH